MTTRNIAYLFPGQGAQYAGIGADLYAESGVVRDTYAEAAEAVGYDIGALSFDAGGGDIHLTRHTQPALLTHAIACLRAWQVAVGDNLTVTLAAGHSLGEYSALVSAGALDFAAALRLVKRRGELMGEFGQGEMQALMVDFATAAELAGRHHCGVAARNLPQQTVVGGAAADLDALLRDMESRFPRKRHARLKTEGAFHTYHMLEAALKFREELVTVEFRPLRFGVLSNFTGDLHDAADAEALKSRLFLQLFNPVLWHDNLTRAVAAADTLIEFGGGLGKDDAPDSKRPALEGMVKKVVADAEPRPRYLAVNNTRTLAAAATLFGE